MEVGEEEEFGEEFMGIDGNGLMWVDYVDGVEVVS